MTREVLLLNDWTGAELQTARKKLGITQKDAADLIYTTQQTISNIERETGVGYLKMDSYQHVLERYYAYVNFLTPCYVQTKLFREMRLNGENRIITPEEIFRELTKG